MRINNNIMALNAHRQLGANQQAGAKSMEKLSSGLRINRAGDDAAGLAISEKMRGQIRGLTQASRNAQDSISMIQTAEGSLNETHAILQRMRELATQSSNDTNTAEDRAEIQAEVDALAMEITRISNNTEFNTQNLLAGGLNNTFHIGANEGQNLALSIDAMDAFSLGVAGSSIQAGDLTGDGQFDSVDVSGSAAAIADGNTITATVSEQAGGSTQEATITSATGVDDVSVASTTGSAVVDGATISLTTSIDDAATSAEVTSTENITDSLIVEGNEGTVTLEVDGGTEVTVTLTDGMDAADIVAQFDAVEGLSASGSDGEPLVLTSDTTGENSRINITGGNADTLAALGLADTMDETGDNATYEVELDDGTTTDTVGGLAEDASQAEFTSGDFEGLTISFDTDLSASTAADFDVSETTTATTYTVTFSDTEGSTDSVISGLAADVASVAGDGDYAGITLGVAGNLTDGQADSFALTVSSGSAATFNADGSIDDEAVAGAGIDVSTQATADQAITTINNAIETVSTERSKLGATQNRLEHTISNLGTAAENLQAAESRIRDLDMAQEMMEFTKSNILNQAATAMLAQANMAPQNVLQLLG